MEPFQLPEIEPVAESEVVGGARPRPGGWGRPAAFAAAGLVAGGVLAGSMSAMAADNGSADPSTSGATSSSSGYGAGSPGASGTVDESQPQRPDEKLLTGDTATKVQAAALATYPGATVLRVETDSDGVYEAHLVTADGTRVTVQVGSDFAVTGTEDGPAGGPGHQGGAGAPGGTPPSGTAPGAAPSPSGTA